MKRRKGIARTGKVSYARRNAPKIVENTSRRRSIKVQLKSIRKKLRVVAGAVMGEEPGLFMSIEGLPPPGGEWAYIRYCV